MSMPWRMMNSDGKISFHASLTTISILIGVFVALNSSNMAAAANDHMIVARIDYDVSTEWDLPLFMGRDFWNMLDHKIGKWEAIPQYKKINAEPMVLESAVMIPMYRALGATNDPLAVGVNSLLSLEKKGPLVTNVPFKIGSIESRPPFRTMMPYRPDYAAYERWKKQHPNFLGFEPACEWDNEFIGFLRCKDPWNTDFELTKVFKNSGYSEADIETCLAAIRKTVAESKQGRPEAVAGLKECYNALRRYCFGDDGKMLFLRGGWCFDHYPLEWGAGGVTMETTNTGPYRHQVSMFFARGAARQYRKFWSWYVALFYNGYDSKGKRRNDYSPYYTMASNTLAPPNDCFGKGHGISVSLNRRDRYLGYLNGASFVCNESWPSAYCQLSVTNMEAFAKSQEWELSPHGEAMREWFAFTRRYQDRGVAYTPVALALPFDQGYPQWGESPFSYFKAMRSDAMIDAFMYTLVPFTQNPERGQEGCLANSPYGDIYDVLVLDPPSGPARLETLNNYKVLVLLGKYEFNRRMVRRLEDYVSNGGTLVVNIEQINDLFGKKFVGFERTEKKAGIGKTVRNRLSGKEIKVREPHDCKVVEMHGARTLWEDESGQVLAAINRYGKGNVLTTMLDWMMPRGYVTMSSLMGGREMSFVKLLMDEIVAETLPVDVKGDIQYGVNKRKDGWLVYLVNNNGVTKWTDKDETLDNLATAKVTLNCAKLGKIEKVAELRSGKEVSCDHGRQCIEMEVGPGDVRIISITAK